MELDKIFRSALTYKEYHELIENLIDGGRTTGNSQNIRLVEFTKLNVQRMNRIDKTFHLSDEYLKELNAIGRPLNLLLIVEAWCGDCAQITPIINKITQASASKLELKIVLRDTHTKLIEAYATNGAKAIPKLLVMDKESTVICSWGPRPVPAQNMMLRWKNNRTIISSEEFEKNLHLWYAKDKGATITHEILNLLLKCEKNIMLQH